MFDIAIVGAGPAGCAAANILAEEGFKVLVLEKEKLPREKRCAGGVSLRCVDSMNNIPYALESGIIAADCATKFFENQIPLSESYSKAISPISIEINNYALALQKKIFGSDTHRKHVIQQCISNDSLMETISKIFTHIISYEEGVKRLSTIRLLPSILKSGI